MLGGTIRRARAALPFTVPAVLSLAVGLTTFGIVVSGLEETVWRPLPASRPDTLCIVYASAPGSAGLRDWSYQDYRAFQEIAAPVEGLAAFMPVELAAKFETGAERVWGELVTDNFFDVLG